MESVKRDTIRAMNANRPPNPTDTDSNCVTACVLAGGSGERIGRRNKGLVPWPTLNSPPIIATVLQRLKPQVDEIVVSANADISQYETFGYRVASDLPGLVGAGPLAGLLTVGEFACNPWMLVAAVDGPRLPLDLSTRLLAAGADIAVAHDGKRLQPLSMLLKRHKLPDLRQYLEGGGRSVSGWLERHEYLAVDFSDQPNAFVNLNTDADFKACQ